MRIQNFEEVISWQKGQLLYQLLSKGFRNSRDYVFKDQLLRATLSISNNIAEGFDRGSDKEFRQFLIIARGSCAEVRSMLHIALSTGKTSESLYEEAVAITTEISKLLTGFIKKLETNGQRLETRP